MKNVKVNAYQVGLVFKKGEYQRVLTAGTYWFWDNVVVDIYDITKQFHPSVELNILLQDQSLADILHVIEVKDGEIVLVFENGLLKLVLTAGRYTFWKSVVKYEFVRADTNQINISDNIDPSILRNKLLAPYLRTFTVESFEKALLFVDGRYVQPLASGVYYWWKNSSTIHVGKVDIRQQQLEVNGQEILTKDKAALRINAWAQFQVVDVEKALMQNKDWDKQLYVAFQLALREYVAGFSFDDLLEKKETIVPFVLQTVKLKAEGLGGEVSGFGIRDIVLPGDVKEIMTRFWLRKKKRRPTRS
jgi:regulator of protease activity HflC (stomatin/prohibitin superfamily)